MSTRRVENGPPLDFSFLDLISGELSYCMKTSIGLMHLLKTSWFRTLTACICVRQFFVYCIAVGELLGEIPRNGTRKPDATHSKFGETLSKDDVLEIEKQVSGCSASPAQWSVCVEEMELKL